MTCPNHDATSSIDGERAPAVELTVLDLPTIADSRGALTVCEFERHLPFTPRRLFYIHGVPAAQSRGGHAHRACDQVFICAAGSATLEVDNGRERLTYRLDAADKGYFVPAGLWGDLSAFETGTVLLVLASHEYDADDYIRDHDAYLEWVGQRA